MNLSAPTKPLFLIALILAILGVVGKFVDIPVLSEQHFWAVFVGFVVLVIGCVMKGA